MNKDLYIKLLEEHVDDLTTAAKIETVLTSRKNCLIKRLSAELTAMKVLGTAQDELLSKVADTVLDYQDDLNDLQADWAVDYSIYLWEVRRAYKKNDELISDIRDLQADWAADHAEYRKTLEVIKEQNTRECDLNVRLQGKIAELEVEKAQLTKKNQCLLEDIKAYGKALAEKEENK